MHIHAFEKTTMKYLLFLVHVQQSIKLSAGDKIKAFDSAKITAKSIFSNIQSYLSNKNEYNSFDKDAILSKNFSDIQKRIEKEFDYYKKDITINNVDFSYYGIIDTLTDTKYAVSLNRNDIKQMLSYNELSGNSEKDKIEKKQTDELKDRSEEEFRVLRQKAFCSMLHGNDNTNPMRFFDVNDYILKHYGKNDITYVHDKNIQIKEGVCFIETQGERIIKLKYEKRQIEYSFRIIDLHDVFVMYIQGYIKINDAKEEFYINEKYLNSQFGRVMNAYNLKKIIDIFNELGHEDNGNSGGGPPSDIDNFLAGKIK